MNTNAVCQSYQAKQAYLEHRKQKIKYSLYKKLTRQALPLFTRGKDIISIPPLANGVYEPEITALIGHFAGQGCSDFLLDIGANIGLTSCQSGVHFDEVHMFEPNPDCLSILKVNAKIALRTKAHLIYPFGLGSKSERLKLHVPYDNWGGAFIQSGDNEYNQSLLSEKDGYGNFNAENYQILEVQVESAVDTLHGLFADLADRGKSKGVIKIDVEGYEKLVLEAIAKAIPDHFEVFVVFENWASGTTLPLLPINAPGRVNFYFLSGNKTPLRWAPRWLNSLYNFSKGGFSSHLEPAATQMQAGTYILAIGQTSPISN
jgi:FkbM family methyltransferase